jgi:hypothetical protein
MGLDLKATIFGCTQGKSVVTAYGPKYAKNKRNNVESGLYKT